MYCSPDEGQDILNKWKGEPAVLSAVLVSPRFSFSGTLLVSDCSSEGVRFVPPSVKTDSGEVVEFPGELVLGFEGASFEYSEPREAPSGIRDRAESLFVRVLTIKFPDLVLTLSEMRNQPKFAQG